MRGTGNHPDAAGHKFQKSRSLFSQPFGVFDKVAKVYMQISGTIHDLILPV